MHRYPFVMKGSFSDSEWTHVFLGSRNTRTGWEGPWADNMSNPNRWDRSNTLGNGWTWGGGGLSFTVASAAGGELDCLRCVCVSRPFRFVARPPCEETHLKICLSSYLYLHVYTSSLMNCRPDAHHASRLFWQAVVQNPLHRTVLRLQIGDLRTLPPTAGRIGMLCMSTNPSPFLIFCSV
jgi:hypothetical protein